MWWKKVYLCQHAYCFLFMIFEYLVESTNTRCNQNTKFNLGDCSCSVFYPLYCSCWFLPCKHHTLQSTSFHTISTTAILISSSFRASFTSHCSFQLPLFLHFTILQKRCRHTYSLVFSTSPCCHAWLHIHKITPQLHHISEFLLQYYQCHGLFLLITC